MTKAEICKRMFWYVRRNFEQQADAAKHFEVSDAFISAVVHGHKPPSKVMLDELGYEKRVSYQRVKK